jgi:hypothetical protein
MHHRSHLISCVEDLISQSLALVLSAEQSDHGELHHRYLRSSIYRESVLTSVNRLI